MSGQQALPYSLAESARNHGYDAAQPMPEREPASSQVRAEFLAEYARILDAVELPERLDEGIHGEGLARLIRGRNWWQMRRSKATATPLCRRC